MATVTDEFKELVSTFQTFWFIYFLAQCVDLYSYVRTYLNMGLPHFLPFATFTISLVLVIVSLTCHFFAEPHPDYQVT